MSGGSWDYAYGRIDDVVSRLMREPDPLRRALGARLALMAKALHDIEWVDSGDYSPGDEVASIRAALAPGDEDRQVRDDLRAPVERATELLGGKP